MKSMTNLESNQCWAAWRVLESQVLQPWPLLSNWDRRTVLWLCWLTWLDLSLWGETGKDPCPASTCGGVRLNQLAEASWKWFKPWALQTATSAMKTTRTGQSGRTGGSSFIVEVTGWFGKQKADPKGSETLEAAQPVWLPHWLNKLPPNLSVAHSAQTY